MAIGGSEYGYSIINRAIRVYAVRFLKFEYLGGGNVEPYVEENFWN